MIEEMKTERREVQWQVRKLNSKLPIEIAGERHYQKVLASKRAWWRKHQIELKALKAEKPKRAKVKMKATR
jgi:hypothetical protein